MGKLGYRNDNYVIVDNNRYGTVKQIKAQNQRQSQTLIQVVDTESK